MRLVDADAFKAEGRKLYREAGWDLREVHYSQLDTECNIDMMPTIEAEPRWIPIEQDCPEKGKDVLISHNGVVSIDWLTQSEGIGYFFVSGVAVQDIDAWMPLPEPYKMDEVKE